MYDQMNHVLPRLPLAPLPSAPVDEPVPNGTGSVPSASLTAEIPSSSEVPTLPRKIRRRAVVAAINSAPTAPTPATTSTPDGLVAADHTSVPRKAPRRRCRQDCPFATRCCAHHCHATAAAAITTARVPAVDLAWAAGFFDGEGSIGAYEATHGPNPNGSSRKPSLRLVASVAQNRPEILQEFLEIVGVHGKLYQVRRQVCHNKQCYTLKFDGRHALELLYVLRPRLHRKQYEADAARDLAIHGRLGMYPGPNGFPPEVVSARKFYKKKLSRLK